MADPLLNTLCTICHTNAPKYVCPGCSAQTCSLPCTTKHKSWANCSGRRDPTAFMPASRLKTASGVDHDYNFLSAIERERDRNQRDMVGDRHLFTETEVRQLDDESRFRKKWFGDEVRFDPIRGGAGAGGPRNFAEDKGEDSAGDGDDDGAAGATGGSANVPARATHLTRQVRQRLDNAGIQVVQMPTGMTRQRENTTSWNRKSKNINWCVEWMVYHDDGGDDRKTTTTPTRIRHKALETVPLYKALANSMAWYRKGQQQQDDEDEDEEESAYARKRRRVLIKEVKEERGRTAMQDGDSATWAPTTPYPTQNPYAGGAWGLDRGASVTSWLPDEEVEARRGYRYYLVRPLTPAGKPKELIPVTSTETLSSALRGRTVLEYPTIYTLPPTADSESGSGSTHVLPEGFILGSTERRERVKRNNNNNNNNSKRKASEKNDKSLPPHKRQATGEGGIPIRSSNGPNSQRGRGGAGAARGVGRGGRSQQGRGNCAAQDAEEGEIDSDGDEVTRQVRHPVRMDAAADTSSSDPVTSSDEDEDEGKGRSHVFSIGMQVDDDGPPEQTKSTAAAAAGTEKKSGLGLVEYGSDSDGSEGDEEDEGVDLAGLKPENPELVASAIKEIVGLFAS